MPEPHLCVKAAVTTALSAIPPGLISKQIIISHKNRSQFKHRLPAILYLDSDFSVTGWIFSPPATAERRGNTEALLGESFHELKLIV